MTKSECAELMVHMCQIAAYVRQHPHAADTAEGVMRWWLGGANLPLSTVEQALEGLAERGVMSIQIAADGRRRFRFSGDVAALERVME